MKSVIFSLLTFLCFTSWTQQKPNVVIIFMDIFGVKWRNWKLHLSQQDSWHSIKSVYTMPKVYNLYDDPQERNDVLFPNTWVPKAALVQLQEQ